MNINPLTDLAHSWWVPVFYGVIALLFGGVALFMPMQAAIGLTIAIGIMALIEGIVSGIALFSKRVAISKGWIAFYAVVSILFGVLAIARPLVMGMALMIFMGAWLVVGGIYRIIVAIQIRKAITGEWLIAISGVLAIILGVLLMVWPASGLAIAMIWIGLLAIIYGLFQIIAGFRIRRFRTPI